MLFCKNWTLEHFSRYRNKSSLISISAQQRRKKEEEEQENCYTSCIESNRSYVIVSTGEVSHYVCITFYLSIVGVRILLVYRRLGINTCTPYSVLVYYCRRVARKILKRAETENTFAVDPLRDTARRIVDCGRIHRSLRNYSELASLRL